MPCKLLITHQFLPTGKLGKFYKEMIITNEPYKLVIKIKNLGEKFPGGEFALIKVTTGLQWMGRFGRTLKSKYLPKIPEIAPQDELTIEVPLISVEVEGFNELEIRIKAVDDRPIEYYIEEFRSKENAYKYLFHARKFEDVAILHALNKILKKRRR